MSVPKWKQQPSELNIFYKALEFSNHILKITSNKNIFKEEYFEFVTKRIITDALDVYSYLWKANNTNLKKNFERRQELQRLAYESIIDFKIIWALAKKTFHLKNAKDVYVITSINAIKDELIKWTNSDITRFKEDKPIDIECEAT